MCHRPRSSSCHNEQRGRAEYGFFPAPADTGGLQIQSLCMISVNVYALGWVTMRVNAVMWPGPTPVDPWGGSCIFGSLHLYVLTGPYTCTVVFGRLPPAHNNPLGLHWLTCNCLGPLNGLTRPFVSIFALHISTDWMGLCRMRSTAQKLCHHLCCTLW